MKKIESAIRDILSLAGISIKETGGARHRGMVRDYDA